MRWEEAERQVGHLVPEAWLRFVDRFGCGQIWVAAETRIDAHSVTGEAMTNEFYIDSMMDPGSFVRDWASISDPEIGPCPPFGQVGYPGNGDVLFIKCSPGPSRPENGELVVWWDHEYPLVTYRWPNVEAWLQHMIHLHDTGVQMLLGKKREAAHRVEAFATKARDVLLREGEVAPLPSVRIATGNSA